MTLRRRLLLTMLLAALPLLAGVLWLRRDVELRRLTARMREYGLATMEAGGRERCERNPARFQVDTLSPAPGPRPEERERPRPPPGAREGAGPDRPPPPPPPRRLDPLPLPPEESGTRLFAYAADLTSANPRAPAVPPELAERLRAGAGHADGPWAAEPHRGRQVLLRTPWPDGPCAVLLVQRPFELPPWTGDWVLGSALALVGGLLLAVLAAAGPLVRRIRRLEAGVRASAGSGYRLPVGVGGRDELGRLGEAFEAAGHAVREELARTAARELTLREFVANTTHDVAIPLTVLQGHLADLRAAAEDGLVAPRETVRDAFEEAHYLGCLLQNLGTAARLEGGGPALERGPVDLGVLVERVAARHRPMALERGVSLVHALAPEPVLALADETLLEQAVSNLVSNAVRHGAAGGHVAVVLTVEREPAQFVLRVFDDGPGVPDEELPRLTERAYRGGAARSRAPDGRGLGLAIALDVAQRHGFRLTLARAEVGGLEARLEGPRVAVP